MSEGAPIIRLSKAAREFNIGVSTIVDFLSKKGLSIEKDPNFKLSPEMYIILVNMMNGIQQLLPIMILFKD